MWNWIKALNRILRGEATGLPALRRGKLDVPILGLAVVIDLLGFIYGICMGLFSITPGGSHHPMQLVATTVKVPALFLLTLFVTFPSLYVFNALVGSRLFLPSVLRLLLASLAVMLAVLASVGPIVAFFTFTTTSYEFMIILNVIVFGISGVLGLAFLLQTLHRLTLVSRLSAEVTPETQSPFASVSPADAGAAPEIPVSPPPPTVEHRAGPLDHPTEHVLAPHVKTIFRIWVIVFGLVGSQMAWVLRPFIGHPDQPFTWFRHPYSNFFQAVFRAATHLF